MNALGELYPASIAACVTFASRFHLPIRARSGGGQAAEGATGPGALSIVAGDIVLTVNGTPTRSLRRIATHFASDSIGRKAELRVIRGGTVLSLQAIVEARPAA